MKTKWLAVLAGIIYTISAIYMILNPVDNLVSLSWLLAFAVLAGGITELLAYFNTPKVFRDIWALVSAIVTILAGIYLLSGAFVTLPVLIPTIIGVWLLVFGIIRIVRYYKLRQVRPFLAKWSLVQGIIGLIFGLVIYFNPLAASVTVGFVIAVGFLYHGVTLIVDAFKGYTN